MKKLNFIIALFLTAGFLFSCGFSPKKKLKISFKIIDKRSMSNEYFADLIDSRLNEAFDIDKSDIKRLNFTDDVYSVSVNGMPIDSNTRKNIHQLFRTSSGVGFWRVYDNEVVLPCLIKANDTLKNHPEFNKVKIDTGAYVRWGDSVISGCDVPPLFYLLNSSYNYRNPNSIHLAEIGYAIKKDTGNVMYIFRNEKIKKLFPEDCRLAWSAKINDRGYFSLYCLRNDPKTKGAALALGNLLEANKAVSKYNGAFTIEFTMNNEDAVKWKDLTADCQPRDNKPGQYLAIVQDDFVWSAPVVQGEIAGGRSQITGSFTAREADELAMLIKAGNFPIEVTVINIEEEK